MGQSEEQEEGKRVRRRLRHTGEGSIVTHWPHCQVNATWVFYRQHCSRWHFECTSHTLSLSITHSLHFLGQPPRLTLSRAAALAENSLQDRVVVAAAAEVRGGDEGKDTEDFRVDPGACRFSIEPSFSCCFLGQIKLGSLPRLSLWKDQL